MSANAENTVTLPGPSVSVESGQQPPATAANLTFGAVAVPFEQVKHLLSDKPLRPPVRPTRFD